MKGKSNSPLTTGFLIINQMLGTGPIIIPSVFILGGIGLSSIFLILIGILSYISTLFLCESHSICNFIKQQDQLIQTQDIIEEKNKQQDSDESENDDIQHIIKQKLLKNDLANVQNNNIVQENKQIIDKNSFKVVKVYNYGELGLIIFGKWMQILISVMIIAQLIGAISSKVIMTSNIMRGVFSDVSVLNNYYFWSTLCFTITAILSFKEIFNLKWFSNVIAILRVTVILLFIIIPVYLIIKNGSYPLIDLEYTYPGQDVPFEFKSFNFKALPQIFSNLIFAFMSQNSVMNITGVLQPQSKIKYVVFFVFLFSIVISFLISVFGQMAFGGAATDPYNVNNIIYFNNNFKTVTPWFYYFSSFYIFFSVSALPIMAIIIRNNLMKLIVPEKLIDCGTNFQLNRWTVGFTSAIVIIGYTETVFLKDYIQYLLNFTNGTSGVCLMLIFPFTLALQGRRKIYQYYNINKEKYSKLNSYYQVLAEKGGIIPYILLGFSAIIFVLNFYQQIDQLFNK